MRDPGQSRNPDEQLRYERARRQPPLARQRPSPGKVSSTARLQGSVGSRPAAPARTTTAPVQRMSVQDERALLDAGLLGRASERARSYGRGDDHIHAAAALGTESASQPLPHLERIQQAFGHHDASGIRAAVGGRAAEASRAMGAVAYATGDTVAFAESPDLHTAAHEAAHVVQQRGDVQLSGGVGQSGDAYERHADAVADRVVRGESAEALLDEMAPTGAGGPATGVQRQVVQRQLDGEDEAEERPDTSELDLDGPPVCEPPAEEPGQERADGEAPVPEDRPRNPGGEDYDPNSIPARRARLLDERGELDTSRPGPPQTIRVELGDNYDSFVRNVADELAGPFDTGRHRQRGQSPEERRRAARRPEDHRVREQFARQSRPAPGADPYLRTIYRTLVNPPCNMAPGTQVTLNVVIYRRDDPENRQGRVITAVRFVLFHPRPEACESPDQPIDERNAAVNRARRRIVNAMPHDRASDTPSGEARIEDPGIDLAQGYLQAWRTYQETGAMPGGPYPTRAEGGRQRAMEEYRNLRRQPDHVWRAILCDPDNLASMIETIQRNYDRLVRESVNARPH